MAHLPGISLFGLASTPHGTAYRFKLLGVDAPADGYHLVLEVTNVLTAYICKFNLESVLANLRESEQGVDPGPAKLLEWIKKEFDDGMVEAVVDDSRRLQLHAQHSLGQGISEAAHLWLPPEGAMQPLSDPKGIAWVAQEVLFSMGEHLRETKLKLEACEHRCPASQQLDDIHAFLAANGSIDEDGRSSSPLPPNVALARSRQQPEPGLALASGSAIAAAGSPGGAAATAGQPSSTQPGRGMLGNGSGKADISGRFKPTKKVGPKPKPGIMQRGIATKVGGVAKKPS